MELWTVVYLQAQSKRVPDKNILTSAALKIIQALTNISAWSADENTFGRRTKTGNLRCETVGSVKGAGLLLASGNSEELIKLMKKVIAVKNINKLAEKNTRRYIQLRNDISDRADMANWIFMFLYFVGSLLLGSAVDHVTRAITCA